MRKINPKSSNIDSFKYSILISLHYYDISYRPERISKLKPFENKYNFTHSTPNEFEICYSNISSTVFDENDNIVYMTKNNSNNKAQIVKIDNNRNAAIKPFKKKFVKLDELLKSFSHLELKEFMSQKYFKNKIDGIELKNEKKLI